MPHDRDGRELHVGDAVLVPCRVRQIHITEEFCNVELETSQPMYPGTHRTGITLNAKQVFLSADPTAAAAIRAPEERGERK